jgi:hypothetical protein
MMEKHGQQFSQLNQKSIKDGTTITILISSLQATTDINSQEQTLEIVLSEKQKLKELKLLKMIIIAQPINVLLKL